ncbi:type II toxin-antitoxin system VapC family toxin [Chamaesiphon sp.]|uniref:type II toxin-antitoxin system VapC family toxin n=1 Tax=Chamaesiphon sp. TaxID=2814140 RepID=UPI003593F1FD
MTVYIPDTDHLSLYGRNHPALIERLQANAVNLTTTAINVEEQLRGRLAQVSDVKMGVSLANAYRWLSETVKLLSDFEVLQFTEQAQLIYQEFKTQSIRVGTQDLRIAAIAIAHNGVLLSRNLRDFEKLPNLMIQDWTV